MHDPRFLKLEGSWRGLHYLVMNSETSTNLKIRVVNASKRELHRDLTRAVEFDQSLLFRKIYEIRIRHAGRGTLWRVDRRLRMDEPSG